MHTTIKIKALIVLAGGALLMGYAGWQWVRPEQSGEALSLLAGTVNWKAVFLPLAFAVVGSALGAAVGRPHGAAIGMLAVPAGLVVWSLYAGSINSYLMQNTAADRTALFHRFIGESVLWTLAVLLGGISSVLVCRRLNNPRRFDRPDDPADPVPARNRAAPSAAADLVRSWLGTAWLNGVSAVALCCIIALLLMKILAQSVDERLSGPGSVLISTAPALNQAVFAVAASFFAGVLIVHQLLRVKIGWFLTAPLWVAVISYAIAAQKAVLAPLVAPSQFVPASMLFAMVLPVQLIGVGSAAVILGYWYSVQMHHHRSFQNAD